MSVELLTYDGIKTYSPFIKQIFKNTGVFEPFEINFLDEQLTVDKDYQWCVLKHKDKIIGASCFGPILKERPGRYDLYWIAIDPEYQGWGFGYQLLEHTEEEARKQGATHMYIETGSFNKSGNRLYSNSGYKLMGVLEEYYNNKDHKHIWGKKL